MSFKLGLAGKLFRNTGTYGTPVWDEVPNVKDLSLSLDADKFDVTTRGNAGFKAYLATLLDAGVEFQMVYDTADVDFTAIQTAFFAKTTIEFAVMDGPMATGAQGLRATMGIWKFSRSEKLAEAMMTDVMIGPAYSTNAATWYTSP